MERVPRCARARALGPEGREGIGAGVHQRSLLGKSHFRPRGTRSCVPRAQWTRSAGGVKMIPGRCPSSPGHTHVLEPDGRGVAAGTRGPHSVTGSSCGSRCWHPRGHRAGGTGRGVGLRLQAWEAHTYGDGRQAQQQCPQGPLALSGSWQDSGQGEDPVVCGFVEQAAWSLGHQETTNSMLSAQRSQEAWAPPRAELCPWARDRSLPLIYVAGPSLNWSSVHSLSGPTLLPWALGTPLLPLRHG